MYAELILSLSLSRILLELDTSDDPVWTYFDSQHKHIMDSMKRTFRITSDAVQSEHLRCHVDILVLMRDECSAKKDRVELAMSGSEASKLLLAGQLQTCVAALKSNQPDSVIGEHSCLTFLLNTRP